jgi:hypothetical protein
MPFTNVIGNGGLLTTVGDLLVWNENLDHPRVSGSALVEQLETRGRLNDGFINEYAQGLVVTSYKGVREISHGGSTAGYQTFLGRFPDSRLSIAVLSNVTASNPSRLAHEVADIYLAGKIKEPAKPAAVPVPAATLKKYVGVYREPLTDAAMKVELGADGKTLLVDGSPVVALSSTIFASTDGARQGAFAAGADGIRLTESDGRSRPRIWESVPAFAPKPAELEGYAGVYHSDEIDMTYRLSVEGGKLKAWFRPAQHAELAPVYADAFETEGDIVKFTRDASGRIDGFLVYAGRVRHLRFTKVPRDH